MLRVAALEEVVRVGEERLKDPDAYRLKAQAFNRKFPSTSLSLWFV